MKESDILRMLAELLEGCYATVYYENCDDIKWVVDIQELLAKISKRLDMAVTRENINEL